MACLMGSIPNPSATYEYRNGCRIMAYVELEEEEREEEIVEEVEVEEKEEDVEDMKKKPNLLDSNPWMQGEINKSTTGKRKSQQDRNEHRGKVRNNINIFEAPST